MNDRMKKLVAEVKQRGWAPMSPIQLSEFDSGLLGRASQVSPGQSLMHYLSIERFKTLLMNKAIRMRRLDLFDGDPHEGCFPEANAKIQSPMSKGFLDQVGLPADGLRDRREFIEGTMRQLTYLHCWFGWDAETQHMWDEYGQKGGGVCIRTTARRLMEALIPCADLHCDLYGVTYSDDDAPVSELISYLALCRKRRRFSDEHEIRLVGQLREKSWPVILTEDATPDHRMVGVNFERLFERVYVGPNASDAAFQEIETLANGAVRSRVVHRSSIDPFLSSP